MCKKCIENHSKFLDNHNLFSMTGISFIMKWITGLFAAFFIIVFIIVAARMYVWCILNPSNLTKETYPCYFFNLFICQNI